MDVHDWGDAAIAKGALRDQVLAARRRRPLGAGAEHAVALAQVALGWDAVRSAATVAAYVSVGSEPGTGLLLDALVAAGKQVIVPVLLPDNDLDWAAYAGPGSLAAATRGLVEPSGPRLGVDAVRTADVVLVPGLAVSPPATASGAAVGRTTGRWRGCPPGRPWPSCSTTTRSGSPCRPTPTTWRWGSR